MATFLVIYEEKELFSYYNFFVIVSRFYLTFAIVVLRFRALTIVFFLSYTILFFSN